ncbi:MAG: globin family protein [Pseudomonadota bacterium]
MTLQTPLTKSEVAAIQGSFARLVPKADDLAREFYDRLFRDNPSVRSLFPSDMTSQREKLVSTLAFVVRGLGDISQIEDAVKSLGVRHRGYKAVPDHYMAVGAALLATLEARLGSLWTPELAQAWKKAYGVVAKTMIDAANNRAA